MLLHPVMPASSAQNAVTVLVARGAGFEGAGGGLLECFGRVPDPRKARGVRYRLATILGLCEAAVAAGAVTVADVTVWITHADQGILAVVGCRRSKAGVCIAPHPDTVERVLAALDAQALAEEAGVFLAERAHLAEALFPLAGPVLQAAIAVDGKAVRGAIGPDGQIPYLLAAATHGGSVVIGERLIGPKTNEVPELLPLLRALDRRVPLAGRVITVDAGLTARAIARGIVGELGAHYVMTIKSNQPALYAQICALAFDPLPLGHTTTDTGHGRREKRTIKVMDAPAHIKALYPHVAQVFVLDRYVTRKVRKRRPGSRKYSTAEVRTYISAVGVTSMTSREAGPEHLMAYVRGHWGIENKIHWVRDVTFREDASQVKTGSRPRVMATLRNLAIGLIRQSGRASIAGTIRLLRHNPDLIPDILDLPQAPKPPLKEHLRLCA